MATKTELLNKNLDMERSFNWVFMSFPRQASVLCRPMVEEELSELDAYDIGMLWHFRVRFVGSTGEGLGFHNMGALMIAKGSRFYFCEAILRNSKA